MCTAHSLTKMKKIESLRGLTKGHSSAGGFVVDPEGDPGEHHDQDGRQVRLEHKVADVSL